jgi:hypothetical protein
MGLAGGGIQGGRFGLHQTLGHDSGPRPNALCVRGSATSRDQVGQRDQSAMGVARGSTATAPGALGPCKNNRHTRPRGPRMHGGARPTNDRDWRSMASAACRRTLVESHCLRSGRRKCCFLVDPFWPKCVFNQFVLSRCTFIIDTFWRFLARFLARLKLKKLKSFCWRLLRCVSAPGSGALAGPGPHLGGAERP